MKKLVWNQGEAAGMVMEGLSLWLRHQDKTQIHPFGLLKSFLPGSNISPLKHLAGILPLTLCWDNGELNESFVLGWGRVIRRGKFASFAAHLFPGFLSELFI